MKNRFLPLLLAVAMLLSLAACGTKTEPDSSTAPETSQGTAPEQTADPAPDTKPEEEATGATEAPNNTPEEPEAETIEAGEGETEIRGGTNQNDAIPLPMNTKVYGVVSDGLKSWLSFTTDSTENATYCITTVNKTVGSSLLYTTIWDEYGNRLEIKGAESRGYASTITTDKLSPNTTYYVLMDVENGGRETIHYRLTIKNPNAPSAGYSTADSVAESLGAAALAGEIHPGRNQDDAAFIPLNVKIDGTVRDGGKCWFAFTTNEVENPTYLFTTVNETVGSSLLYTTIWDEYGNRLEIGGAENGGYASTISSSILSPNTTYYVLVDIEYDRNETIDYTLAIKAPEPPTDTTATITPIEEEPLVFETPFELNSTQVMFVANKAVFIDEAAAKTALEPVAAAILAHPDHSILIAGTTATDGTQASCVDLSNRRAGAVKDLLVNSFGVPESQLKTIGLGYEADPFVRGQDRDANGKFVETEGAKNRRVVILDVDDPIAQELLNP